MRPRGSFGEVGCALLAAAKSGPATASQLAERACVGYSVAAKTASRYVASGHLVKVSSGRPAVLALPDEHAGSSDGLLMMSSAFWGCLVTDQDDYGA